MGLDRQAMHHGYEESSSGSDSGTTGANPVSLEEPRSEYWQAFVGHLVKTNELYNTLSAVLVLKPCCYG